MAKTTSKIVQVDVTCEGINPLLMDRMSNDILGHLRAGTKPESTKTWDPQKVAEPKLYKDGEGNIAIPVDMFWACLVSAGSMIPFKAKKMLSNAQESLLPACLNVRGSFLPFSNGGADPNEGWKVDMRRGALKDIAICIVRPRFDTWGFKATLDVNTNVISLEAAKELVEKAGAFKGIGGHRKKGRFGRFRVTSWKPQNGADKTQTRKSSASPVPSN